MKLNNKGTVCAFLRRKKTNTISNEYTETSAVVYLNANKREVAQFARQRLKPMEERFIRSREIFENTDDIIHFKIAIGPSFEVKGEHESRFEITELENGGTKVELHIKKKGLGPDAKLTLDQFSMEFGEIKPEQAQ